MQNQVSFSHLTLSEEELRQKSKTELIEWIQKLNREKEDLETRAGTIMFKYEQLEKELLDKDGSTIELYESLRYRTEELNIALTFVELASTLPADELARKISVKAKSLYLEHLKNGLEVSLPALPPEWKMHA